MSQHIESLMRTHLGIALKKARQNQLITLPSGERITISLSRSDVKALTGISEESIYAMEKGKACNPSKYNILAEALGMPFYLAWVNKDWALQTPDGEPYELADIYADS